MRFFAVVVSALVSTSLLANSETPVRDQIAKFLETNVIDKPLKIETHGTMSSGGETVHVDFVATIKWTGLRRTDQGLVFDEQRDIKQTNTRVDAAGNPVGEPIINDRQVIHHYAVGERRTTKSLVGITTVTLNTNEDPTGEGYTTMIDMSSDGKELYVYQSMSGYIERSIDGVNDIPVSLATSATV